MIEADEKPKSERRKLKNEGKELSGIGGVFSGVSLQDVFSDSAGNPGVMLKTPCRPEADGGNASQLGVPGTKRKRRVGRKELTVKQKRTRKLQLHLTENEYLELWQRQIALGKKSMAEYLRDLVINEKATNMAINSVALISQMDKIGQEIAKSSTNIRAIANAMENQTDKAIEPQILHRFNPPGGRGKALSLNTTLPYHTNSIRPYNLLLPSTISAFRPGFDP